MKAPINPTAISALILLLVVSHRASGSDEVAPVSVWRAQSTNAIYNAVLQPIGDIEIGRLQKWVIQIVDSANRPVYPARIAIGGGMAGHAHGLPTQPQVTAYGGDGEYLIEGLRFNMEGEWQLSFAIESDLGVDRVSFAIAVAY